jgi:hypothetical protein
MGGPGEDTTRDVAVDAQGNFYVTGGSSGATFSDNFPTTAGAYQSTNRGSADFFAAKFSPDLSTLLYSTYIGGSGDDYGRSSIADPVGNFYVVGMTQSGNWPLINSIQTTHGGNWDGAVVE